MKRILFLAVLVLSSVLIPKNYAQEYLIDSGYVPAPPPPPFVINEKMEQQYLEGLKSNKLKSELMSVKRLNKNKYNSLLMDAYFNSNEFSFFNRGNKELFKAQKEISELEISTQAKAIQILQDSKVDKEKLKNELKADLNKLFDLKQTQKELEVKRLEQELKTLKESLKVRGDNKNSVVNRRLKELLNEEDYLDWN